MAKLVGAFLLGLCTLSALAAPAQLGNATIVLSQPESSRQQAYAKILSGRVAAASTLSWTVGAAADGRAAKLAAARNQTIVHLLDGDSPVPSCVQASSGAASAAEGFQICLSPASGTAGTQLWLRGNDNRGMLYAVGRLLRELQLSPQSALVSAGFAAVSQPETALRGQMISYRSISNSYDGFTVQDMHTYVVDLALWGTNQIEMVAPDGKASPHFTLPPADMAVAVSSIADALDLNVSIWWPQSEANATLYQHLFSKCSRLDSLFVPGGDPGSTPPQQLLDKLEKTAALLRGYHKHAAVYVSHQGFNSTWLAQFFDLLNGRQRPTWLTGVVYGPHTAVSLQQTRLRLADYPIRGYPDVSHGLKAQYPLGNWSTALSFTAAREGVNPRPLFYHSVAVASGPPLTIGFSTYSDGVKDDVNKVIWAAASWNASTPVATTLQQYARLFVTPPAADKLPAALLAMEQHWQGRLQSHAASVNSTRSVIASLFASLSAAQRASNWRMQMLLYRATYDAYQLGRQAWEEKTEEQAMAALAAAPSTGSSAALSAAISALAQPFSAGQSMKKQLFALGKQLFHSIHMQLSVPLYGAANIGRGASLDTIDVPLNNARFLRAQAAVIAKMSSEADRRAAIKQLVQWDDAGEGGVHVNLGPAGPQPVLQVGQVADDPSFFNTSYNGAQEPYNVSVVPAYPLSWLTLSQSLYNNSLRVKLPVQAGQQYNLTVVYAGSMSVPLRAFANGHVLHDWLHKANPVARQTFAVPAAATAHASELLVEWQAPAGMGGNGRGCQVAELWLRRV